MAKSKSSETSERPGFEESLARLEKTVHELEDGHIGLEEALAHYEGGVKLLRHCYDLLAKAQRRIELLSGVDAQGNPVTQPMEEEPSDSLEQKARRRSRRRTAAPEASETAESGHSGDDDDPTAGDDDVDAPGRLF